MLCIFSFLSSNPKHSTASALFFQLLGRFEKKLMGLKMMGERKNRAVVGGVLAILTAAVPVILAPGEDAFNEMRERDGDFSKDFDPRKKR